MRLNFRYVSNVNNFMVTRMMKSSGDRYDISAVSRLTGLSTPNLRMWEKRYGVVEPARTESKRRQYTRGDIRRLTLLKNLVDRGHPIGSIAELSVSDLEKRLEEQAAQRRLPAARGPGATQCRIVVAGAQLTELVGEGKGAIEGVRVVKRFGSLEEAEAKLNGVSADVLLVECPTLFPETVETVQRLIACAHALRAIVIYRFAQSKTARMIDKDIEHVTAMRGPVDAGELRLALEADVALAERSGREEAIVPAADGIEDLERLFTDAQLAKISSISSTIDCECPQHLAGLLFALTAFERYSAECENRSPEDEKLHAYLHRATSRARHTMEIALREVLEAEGLQVD